MYGVLTGKGVIPSLHFLLPDDKSVHRNESEVRLIRSGESSHQLKISAIGLHQRKEVSLWVMNPTEKNIEWDLEFMPDDRIGNQQQFITCVTKRGRLDPGRKQILKFEFETTSSPTRGSWLFNSGEIKHVIMIEAVARESVVILDRTHLSFPRTIIRHGSQGEKLFIQCILCHNT